MLEAQFFGGSLPRISEDSGNQPFSFGFTVAMIHETIRQDRKQFLEPLARHPGLNPWPCRFVLPAGHFQDCPRFFVFQLVEHGGGISFGGGESQEFGAEAPRNPNQIENFGVAAPQDKENLARNDFGVTVIVSQSDWKRFASMTLDLCRSSPP